MTSYRFPMFEPLEPRAEWKGGVLYDTDIVKLGEAARFATKHAGIEITTTDFLRAAARGQILVSAIVHHRAKVEMPGGGILMANRTIAR